MPKGRPALSPAEKSALNPKSIKSAVAAYCYHDCFGEEATNSHATKTAIRDCKNTACPLWLHRGWQNITGGAVKQSCNAAETPEKSPPTMRL